MKFNSGQTAIWVAAAGGHSSVVRTLKNAGADLNVADKDGIHLK